MAWTGHICDRPAAYRATRSGLFGDVNLSMTDANMSSVAVAEAAALTNAEALFVGERNWGIQTARGFRIADNLDASFTSSFAAFYASLPDNPTNSKALMINS